MIAKTETNDLDVLETLENESTEQPENDADAIDLTAVFDPATNTFRALTEEDLEPVDATETEKFIASNAKRFSKRAAEILKALERAREQNAIWGKRTKTLRDELEEEVRRYVDESSDRPLFDATIFAEDGAEAVDASENDFAPSVEYAGTGPVAWRNIRIADASAFEKLTAPQLEKLGIDAGSGTVGDLTDVLDRINSGEKVKGVGKALVEKLTDAFEAFWDSPVYLATRYDANSDGDDADDDFVAPEDRCVYFPASALETEIDVDSDSDETEEPRR